MGACNGFFYGVDRHTGAIVWRYDIGQDGDQTGFHGRCLPASDLVIVATDGSDEGFVYAFEQASGAVRWKQHVRRPTPSDVVHHGELIFVSTREDSLLALELETGAARWSFVPPDRPRFDNFVLSPVVAGDRVVVAGRDGVVYALDAGDGEIAWQQRIDGEPTSPVVAHDRIYVGLVPEGRVVALSADSGTWAAETYATGSLAASLPPVATARDLGIVTESALELWTADLDRLRWEILAPAPFGRSPVTWRDDLVVGTVGGHLVRYRVADGLSFPILQLGGVVTGLVGFDDMLYVGTQEGTLYAVRP